MAQLIEEDLLNEPQAKIITRANVLHRVLVVDDQSLYIKVAVKMLSPYYNMMAAGSGSQALKILSRSFVDLMLLDVEMPDMSGIEVFEKMQQIPDFNTPPVVFVTADKDTEIVTKAIRLGAKDYIVKPFDQKTLLFKVRRVIDNASTDQALLFLKRQLTAITDLFQKGKFSEIEDVMHTIPFNEYSRDVFLNCKRMLIALRSQNLPEAAKILDIIVNSL